ncbi:uncharacterized protein F5147DRAFT_775465 [Suillus discolor]|uniref:DUF6533 domain-containing protein n=1 Tax=Suillus discolor TaxID=1912936 RepID=A0A9P7F350_9AGAM|nr:uncharacterized protein F5147DRAFT_775465 [Suillus discolor]KAG2104643.1 hypothetical protein F5147DRAFT_775465 [Suillus discolor]
MSRSKLTCGFAVVSGIVVVYDWVLTLGQEVELIWRQRWSLMTVLYLAIRYVGIPYSVSDNQCQSSAKYDMGLADRCIIMIARLHAMYQGSRAMLIFLIIIFLTVNIACGVIIAIILKDTVGEELIISGMYMCHYGYEGDVQPLVSVFWTLNTVWEVLALSLSVWIVVKHFRELRRLGPSTGSIIGDCFRVLMQSHVLYFASSVCISCLELTIPAQELMNKNSIATQILNGAVPILSVVQMFVLGPRLILSVREYHAKLMEDSDAETSMNSIVIVFKERVHVSTSSTV